MGISDAQALHQHHVRLTPVHTKLHTGFLFVDFSLSRAPLVDVVFREDASPECNPYKIMQADQTDSRVGFGGHLYVTPLENYACQHQTWTLSLFQILSSRLVLTRPDCSISPGTAKILTVVGIHTYTGDI